MDKICAFLSKTSTFLSDPKLLNGSVGNRVPFGTQPRHIPCLLHSATWSAESLYLTLIKHFSATLHSLIELQLNLRFKVMTYLTWLLCYPSENTQPDKAGMIAVNVCEKENCRLISNWDQGDRCDCLCVCLCVTANEQVYQGMRKSHTHSRPQ